MRHPLHPAFVHFPIACWSLATLADLISLRWGESIWWLAGILLAIGTLSALAAMATGFIELLKVGAEHPANADLNRHMGLIMGAWLLYAASLFLRLHGLTLAAPGMAGIALSVAGFVVLGVAGWFGGRLVYTHGIGVSRFPQAAVPPVQ